MPMQAVWNGRVIAEGENTVEIEGNHYFAREAVDERFLVPSTTTSVCPWKGTAHYYSLEVDGVRNPDAVWFYPDPKPAAAEIRDRLAFWKGVAVTRE
ncbi:hypothetical protein A6F68_01649 [Tsuneonella dongtanensis]|uniref:DUF427 domain-containing protein n=1 Tax=Tsuneonella dongtanensis TaxID=692370 RepID=A0A1B2ADC8_9SPHN|nr:DUF427 domain-containing protein [Tsuneonella dongtanensis]ANY20162.1 hypothetical protein A6F68_01649 [Tsuneonella dongtanensis]